MKIIKNILTENPCYKAGKKLNIKGLMLHSVGTPQPCAKVFLKNWNKSSYTRACVHGFIDAETGKIYQTLPWSMRGWHAGKGTKGTANDSHIGVEMCEPAYIKYFSGSRFNILNKERALEQAENTYRSAVDLFAYLCEEYHLDPYKNIISHKEGHDKGIASNHGDPDHLWKGLGMNHTMDGFREDVAKKMSENIDTNEVPDTKYLKVQVIIDDLNYRSEPSMDGVVLGQTGKGIFTIIETKGGWGKLKSGAGWIWLKNPKYCKLVTE